MKTTTLTLLPALKWLALAMLTLPAPASAQWTNDPWNGMVPVCTEGGDQGGPLIGKLGGAGNYMMFWGDSRNPEEPRAYYQIFNSAGISLYAPNGRPLIESPYWYTGVYTVLPDGEGGLIAVFRDRRDIYEDVYGQRFDSLGNRLWGETGLPLVVWPGTQSVTVKDVNKDSRGAYFISWGYSAGSNNVDIYIQKFNGEGIRLWGDYGAPVCTLPSNSDVQQSVPDEQGGIIDVWVDNRMPQPPPTWKFYAQHLNSSGQPLWATNGLLLYNPQTGNPLGGALAVSGAVPDNSGGGVWTYDTFWNWFVFRLTGEGQVTWLYNFYLPDTCTIYEPKFHPADSSIWFLTSEQRAGQGWGTYIYHFDLNGNMLFDTSVSSLGITQGYLQPPVLSLVDEGIIAVANWSQNSLSVIAATRLTNDGTQLWQNEVALIHQVYSFLNVSITSDGADGSVCAWTYKYENFPMEGDIYAQHVQADGSLGNPLPPYPYAPDYPRFNLYARGSQVHFFLPQAGLTTLTLYDLLGRKIRNLVESYWAAGEHTVAFDPESLPSGLYLLRLMTPKERQTIKVIVVR